MTKHGQTTIKISDGVEYEVTFEAQPSSILSTPSDEKSLYALWEWNPKDCIGKVMKLSSDSKYEREAQVYDCDDVVMSKWMYFGGDSGSPKNGCTRIPMLYDSDGKKSKSAFVLEVDESEHGETNAFELYVMSFETIAKDVEAIIRKFLKHRCCLCEPDLPYDKNKEAQDLLTEFVNKHEVQFGECSTDFHIRCYEIHVSSD